jgi:hypothetical protein
MWNGNVAKAAALLLLAASITSITACDSRAPASQAAQGATAPTQAIQLRHRVDPARNRVWSLTPQGLFLHETAAGAKVAVNLPAWQWAGEPYGCVPDLALGPKGEAVVTSDVMPTLWRIDPESLAISVHSPQLDADVDQDVGFSAIAYSSAQSAWFAVSSQGSLWRIDPLFRRAEKLALRDPLPKACGLAGSSRSASLGRSRVTGLCLRTTEGTWVIDVFPDQRSAYARAAPCIAHGSL